MLRLQRASPARHGDTKCRALPLRSQNCWFAGAEETAKPSTLFFLWFTTNCAGSPVIICRENVPVTRCRVPHWSTKPTCAQDFPLWQNRAHFFAVAAQLMRQILVDHARTHRASKRGGDVYKVSLDEAGDQPQATDVDIVALDDALKNLAEMDSQQSKVVELKFFAGLSIEDTAEVLGISASTVKRDWITARAWLYRELDRSST